MASHYLRVIYIYIYVFFPSPDWFDFYYSRVLFEANLGKGGTSELGVSSDPAEMTKPHFRLDLAWYRYHQQNAPSLQGWYLATYPP